MESIAKSTAPAVRRQPRVVSREQALSVFESGVSYMLNAGWKMTFETTLDEQGVPTTAIRIVACEFSVDEAGMGAFDVYAPPSATNVPNVVSPEPVVA